MMMSTTPSASRRVIVISGPSGSGKSTLLTKLLAEHPTRFGFSVSHTTRPPRPTELDGHHYHFVNFGQFERMIKEGKFIEHAQFSSNHYGTSIEAVRRVTDEGKTCILDLEVNGVKAMHRLKDEIPARFLFIQPPSIEELRRRLVERNTESVESLEARLKTAAESMEFAKQPGSYDHVIVNDDFESAYREFESILLS